MARLPPLTWRAPFEGIAIYIVTRGVLHFQMQPGARIRVGPRQGFVNLDPKSGGLGRGHESVFHLQTAFYQGIMEGVSMVSAISRLGIDAAR